MDDPKRKKRNEEIEKETAANEIYFPQIFQILFVVLGCIVSFGFGFIKIGYGGPIQFVIVGVLGFLFCITFLSDEKRAELREKRLIPRHLWQIIVLVILFISYILDLVYNFVFINIIINLLLIVAAYALLTGQAKPSIGRTPSGTSHGQAEGRVNPGPSWVQKQQIKRNREIMCNNCANKRGCPAHMRFDETSATCNNFRSNR